MNEMTKIENALRLVLSLDALTDEQKLDEVGTVDLDPKAREQITDALAAAEHAHAEVTEIQRCADWTPGDKTERLMRIEQRARRLTTPPAPITCPTCNATSGFTTDDADSTVCGCGTTFDTLEYADGTTETITH